MNLRKAHLPWYLVKEAEEHQELERQPKTEDQEQEGQHKGSYPIRCL